MEQLTEPPTPLAQQRPDAFGKLEKLSLSDSSRIDDAAIPTLAAIKSLKWLDITDTKITPEGAEKLRAGNPALVVVATKISQ